ncbi:MAG: hypothetical protein IJC10_04895 [Clostridia bacterium]|nr:hypothetical protein [Clostridia bacterium]
MTCCFMNFHEKASEKDLIRHFDREIDIAIGRGCTIFLTGTKYPEDEIFAERVKNMAKYYSDGEIKLICLDEPDEALKEKFIQVADWEIYAYELDDYPFPTI